MYNVNAACYHFYQQVLRARELDDTPQASPPCESILINLRVVVAAVIGPIDYYISVSEAESPSSYLT